MIMLLYDTYKCTIYIMFGLLTINFDMSKFSLYYHGNPGIVNIIIDKNLSNLNSKKNPVWYATKYPRNKKVKITEKGLH